MVALLIGSALALGAPPDDTKDPLEGSWAIVCLEKNGMPVPGAANRTATIRDNVVVCDGLDKMQMKAMRLEFGPQGTIWVTELDDPGPVDQKTPARPEPPAPARAGVYALTNEYLVIRVNEPKRHEVARPDPAKPEPVDASKSSGPTAPTRPESAYCTLILKRADMKPGRP